MKESKEQIRLEREHQLAEHYRAKYPTYIQALFDSPLLRISGIEIDDEEIIKLGDQLEAWSKMALDPHNRMAPLKDVKIPENITPLAAWSNRPLPDLKREWEAHQKEKHANKSRTRKRGPISMEVAHNSQNDTPHNQDLDPDTSGAADR